MNYIDILANSAGEIATLLTGIIVTWLYSNFQTYTKRVGALVSLVENGGAGGSANYALGYQFNRNLSLGIGGGLDYYTNYWTSVPVFLERHWLLLA